MPVSSLSRREGPRRFLNENIGLFLLLCSSFLSLVHKNIKQATRLQSKESYNTSFVGKAALFDDRSISRIRVGCEGAAGIVILVRSRNDMEGWKKERRKMSARGLNRKMNGMLISEVKPIGRTSRVARCNWDKCTISCEEILAALLRSQCVIFMRNKQLRDLSNVKFSVWNIMKWIRRAYNENWQSIKWPNLYKNIESSLPLSLSRIEIPWKISKNRKIHINKVIKIHKSIEEPRRTWERINRMEGTGDITPR